MYFSGGSKGSLGMRVPILGPISIQFSGKNGQNNRFVPPLLGIAPSGNPRSATVFCPTLLKEI